MVEVTPKNSRYSEVKIDEEFVIATEQAEDMEGEIRAIIDQYRI